MFVTWLQLIEIIKIFILVKDRFHHKSKIKIFWELLLHSNFNTAHTEEFQEPSEPYAYNNEYLKQGRVGSCWKKTSGKVSLFYIIT